MPSVLITGASKGIGRATAAEFTRRGYRVIATARDPRTLDHLDVDQRLRLDVTDQASVDEAIAAAGKVDILVSNAGVTSPVPSRPIRSRRSIASSPRTPPERSGVTQAVLPQIRERKSGRLLFVSSFLGRHVFTGNAAYPASKRALEALGEALAIETSPFGIHTTLLHPGPASSGALDNPLAYQLPDDPYAGSLATDHMDGSGMITPEFVATAIAGTAELDAPPLRVPVGDIAGYVLCSQGRPRTHPICLRR